MSEREKPPISYKPRRRLRSWTLALILSLVLIAGWAAFLAMAPAPDILSPPTAATPAPVAAAPAPGNQMRLLAWRNAIDADVLSGFASDTGIKVIVDGYDTPEQLLALADGGDITQDVVLVSGIGLKALVDRDLLRPFDSSDLVNARNVDPALTARASVYDAGNAHALPLLWGTVGLGYDAAKIAERLGTDAALDSWAALFDPANAAKLKDCGIQVIDSPTAAFPVALTYLKLPADSPKVEDTDAAARLWEGIKSSVKTFSTNDVVDNLAAGQVCMALATSGDVYQARAKARAAGLASDIRYVLPKEGTVVQYTLLGVPRVAANTANGVRFVDYLLRPEVAARLTNARGFANTVQGAALYIKPEIKSDAGLMPDLAAAQATDEVAPAPTTTALRNRFWQLINTPATAPAEPAAPAAK